jgi:hypothetical protein
MQNEHIGGLVALHREGCNIRRRAETGPGVYERG